MTTKSWTRYYERAGHEPRETLVFALERFEEQRRSGFAVDLGCGTGPDTLELLRRGWDVLAIDAQREALARLPDDPRLATQLARFEDADWPDADLINASFSLPFCPPREFPELWRKIRDTLRSGGRFCGQLFGDRDGWTTGGSPSKGEITFHSRVELDELVRPFVVERLDEVEEDGETAVGAPKHWHVYHLVVRKP